MMIAPPLLKSLISPAILFPCKVEATLFSPKKKTWRNQFSRPNSLPAPGFPGGKNRGLHSFQPAIPMRPSGQLLNSKSAFK
jgi:hypothetical protein